MKRRFVCLSDTHNRLSDIRVPEGDVLIHAGDSCLEGKLNEWAQFCYDMSKLPHAVKIAIGGNHDGLLETDPAMAMAVLAERKAFHYLQDSGLNLDLETMEVLPFGSDSGIRVYGSPHTPAFYNWFFNVPRGEPLREIWAKIPAPLDLLITHGPPYGIGDYSDYSSQHVGDQDLLDAILERVKPKVHMAGHIHPGHGVKKFQDTWFINAAIGYQIEHTPIVFDWDGKDDFEVIDVPDTRRKFNIEIWEDR